MTQKLYLEIVVNLHCAFNDYQKMQSWLETKNPNFGGISPLRLIAMGQGKKVLNFIINALDGGELSMTTPAVKSQGEFIVLKPKFKEHLFNGYDQVDGSHFYDTAGKEYRFVPESKLTEALELVDELLVELARLNMDAPLELTIQTGQIITRAKQKRETL